jgi:hypothetical protein
MTTATPTVDRVNPAGPTGRRTSLTVLIAAWLVPVFVLGQFALMAGLPIAVLLIGTLRDARLRALHWWTGAVTAAYAVPLAVWLIGPSSAPSLSKFLSPVATGAVVAVAVAVAIAHHVGRRRSGAA